MSTRQKQSRFDANMGLLAVSGGQQTAETLIAQVERYRKSADISLYRICKNTGMNVGGNSVRRFLRGYSSPSEKKNLKNPSRPGRVSLETALAILHAMGLDLEVVVREN